MILSFWHKALQRFYETDSTKGLPQDMIERIRDILTALGAALDVSELNNPSFRIHRLKGNLKGWWAVTVRANWRIIFGLKQAMHTMWTLLIITKGTRPC